FMADADSILAHLERVHESLLAIRATANAAQGSDPRRGLHDELTHDLAFGFCWMAERAIDQVEEVKTMMREARNAA
ncbi:hypothetical protein KC219_25565, partial [Mycobacterium tuberculosis]|nr:hypothetical protein [Mycobacterium tuberculosis]